MLLVGRIFHHTDTSSKTQYRQDHQEGENSCNIIFLVVVVVTPVRIGFLAKPITYFDTDGIVQNTGAAISISALRKGPFRPPIVIRVTVARIER